LNYDKLLKSILPHIKWNYRYNGNINKFKSKKGVDKLKKRKVSSSLLFRLLY
jgi:hypothetical protein